MREATIMLRMEGGDLPTQAACSLFGASAFGNRWYTGGDGNGWGEQIHQIKAGLLMLFSFMCPSPALVNGESRTELK